MICLSLFFVVSVLYLIIIQKGGSRVEGIVLTPEHLTVIAIGISVLTFLFSAYVHASKDNTDNTTERTTVIVKLDNIEKGVDGIKSEMSSLRNDQRDDHDRLIKVETSLASLWKRINEISNGGNINE